MAGDLFSASISIDIDLASSSLFSCKSYSMSLTSYFRFRVSLNITYSFKRPLSAISVSIPMLVKPASKRAETKVAT